MTKTATGRVILDNLHLHSSHLSFKLIRNILQPDARILDSPAQGTIWKTAALAFASLAAYGFTAGVWRSPEMGIYTAIKMPLMVACTLVCNSILNGLLGLLLGGLDFRQSLLALLQCFAVAALILGALSPVTLFAALQFSPPGSAGQASAHALHQLLHILLVAAAGVTGCVNLYRLLLAKCSSKDTARITLTAWLAGNAILGAQFSWIFRPFFGQPSLEVTFLRPHPMQGSFYDAAGKSIRQLSSQNGELQWLVPVAFLTTFLVFSVWRRNLAKPL